MPRQIAGWTGSKGGKQKAESRRQTRNRGDGMSELRHNPITGHWVIVAENRGARPQEIFSEQTVLDDFQCPFCEGREERTPDESLARREPASIANGPGWRVRVVPNKYPALEE